MARFKVINERSTQASLFSVHQTAQGKVEKPEGVVSPGTEVGFSAPEGETWVARDTSLANSPTVAVYEVSARVVEWTIRLAATGLPPALEARDAGDYNESLTFNSRFLPATGKLRAVMLFVDFSDASAVGQPWSDEKAIFGRLVGDAASELQMISYKALDLKVDPVPGWKQMPNPVTRYADYSKDPRRLVSDAVKLYPQVNFSQYDIVYVVMAQTPILRSSPPWVAKSDSIQVGTARISYAVTFGEDSYLLKNETFLFLHETYHLFGLPDLYDGGEISGRGYSDCGLGEWDLMATQDGDSGLLGWHRLKLGWLHLSQILSLDGAGSFEIDLADWQRPEGIKGVMVPINAAADFDKATMAYVVEVASRGACNSPGVLVYSVNASLPTCERAIQMRGGADALSAKPLKVGDVFEHRSGGTRISVLHRNKDGFRVKVERN